MSLNSARVETCTTRLLNSWHGPNRFAYHGATLRNIRQPCSSPNTSTIKSRCRHITRTRSLKAGSGGSLPSELEFFSLSPALSPLGGAREMEENVFKYCNVC